MQAELNLDWKKTLHPSEFVLLLFRVSSKPNKAQVSMSENWRQFAFSPGWQQQKKDVCGFRFLDILKGFSTDFSKHSYIYNA